MPENWFDEKYGRKWHNEAFISLEDILTLLSDQKKINIPESRLDRIQEELGRIVSVLKSNTTYSYSDEIMVIIYMVILKSAGREFKKQLEMYEAFCYNNNKEPGIMFTFPDVD